MRIRLTEVLCGLLLIGCCASCDFMRDQSGYQEKLYFPREGGTKEIDGETPCHALIISDAHANETNAPRKTQDGELWDITHDWLTVQTIRGETKMVLTSAPMEGKGRRVLFVRGRVMNKYFEIKVIQE